MSVVDIISATPSWLTAELTDAFNQLGFPDLATTIGALSTGDRATGQSDHILLNFLSEELATYLISRADHLLASRLSNSASGDATSTEHESAYRALASALIETLPPPWNEDTTSTVHTEDWTSQMESSENDRSSTMNRDLEASFSATSLRGRDFTGARIEYANLSAGLSSEMISELSDIGNSNQNFASPSMLTPLRTRPKSYPVFFHDSLSHESEDLEQEGFVHTTLSELSDGDFRSPIDLDNPGVFDDEHLASPFESPVTVNSLIPESEEIESKEYVPPTHRCIACLDEATVEVPCGHHFDSKCLLGIFEAAITNEAMFPARCCSGTYLSVRLVDDYADEDFILSYLDRLLEMTTTKRLYCPNSLCSAFIGEATLPNVQNQTACHRCGTVVCTACKSYAHELNEPCIDVEEEQPLVLLAEEKGWQRCQRCRRIVERTEGCLHMSCPCGEHFCYRCGSQWEGHSVCQGQLIR